MLAPMRLAPRLRFCGMLLATSALVLALAVRARADTAIETETAQIGAKGDIGISNSVEYEWAKDGKAMGTLSQFEYGISDRCEILIEPFFQEWEFPDGESSENGLGDLEITPSYAVVQEKESVPALLLAMKLKVPTGDTPTSSAIALGRAFFATPLRLPFNVGINIGSNRWRF